MLNLVFLKNGTIQVTDDDGTFTLYGTNRYCVERDPTSSLIITTCELADEDQSENADLGNRGHDMASICESNSIIYSDGN